MSSRFCQKYLNPLICLSGAEDDCFSIFENKKVFRRNVFFLHGFLETLGGFINRLGQDPFSGLHAKVRRA